MGPGLLHQAADLELFTIAAHFLKKGADATECLLSSDNSKQTSALLLLIEAASTVRLHTGIVSFLSCERCTCIHVSPSRLA